MKKRRMMTDGAAGKDFVVSFSCVFFFFSWFV